MIKNKVNFAKRRQARNQKHEQRHAAWQKNIRLAAMGVPGHEFPKKDHQRLAELASKPQPTVMDKIFGSTLK